MVKAINKAKNVITYTSTKANNQLNALNLNEAPKLPQDRTNELNLLNELLGEIEKSNTLFDELVKSLEEAKTTIKDFEKLSKEEIKSFDLNDSIIHVDFMIGSADLNIKAILEDGSEVVIFNEGTWAI